MALFKTRSAAVYGIDAYPLDVEVDLYKTGMAKDFTLVGMPDTAVRESRERIKSALFNSGFLYPNKAITINLAPANVRKEGAGFDLPMALGILGSQGPSPDCDRYFAVGELSLDGAIRPIRGALSIAVCARSNGVPNLILPLENAAEAAIVEGINVFGVRHLAEAVDLLNALSTLNDAPERLKQEPAWVLANNWALINAGDQAKARKAADDASARGSARGSTMDLILQDGFLKLTAKNFAGARAAFEQVLASDPGNLSALNWLGQSYVMQNLPAAGTEKMASYVSRQPKSPAVQMLWANWLFEHGSAQQVRDALSAAKAADPQIVAPDLLSARLDFKEGKIEDARRTLTRTLSLGSHDVAARMMLGDRGLDEELSAGNGSLS